MTTGTKQYHIEGLRGLAIILIVLFHMNARWFPVGYLGVDVFLVISGYLLFLRPIQREGQSKSAAAWSFIRRKCGRLMWPLSVAALISMAVAYYMLVPGDLTSTAKTARCALVGVSNIYLGNLKNGGYFAQDASFNLMVPTWYLSLVCQAYLLFLAGWLLVPRKWIKCVVAIGIVLSFAYANLETLEAWFGSLTGSQLHLFRRLPGYYSFGTRIWEVLAGGVVCVLPAIRSGKMASLVAGVSVALVLFLLFYPTENQSLATLAMVTATVLCIRYANDGFVKKALTNPVLLWFGKISFSLYLVHMTIVVAVLCFICEFNAWTLALTFAGTVAVALLFYHTIEKKHYPLGLSVGVWLVALSLSLLLSKSRQLNLNGWLWKDVDVVNKSFPKWRLPADKGIFDGLDTQTLETMPELLRHITKNPSGPDVYFVNLGNRDDLKPNFVLFGDSHAASLYPALNEFACQHGLSGVFLTSYIYPLADWEIVGNTAEWSPQREVALLKWLEAHPEIRTVVFAQRWIIRWRTLQAKGFHSLVGEDASASARKFFTAIHKLGKNIIISTHAPELKTRQPIRSYSYYKRFGVEKHREHINYSLQEYNEELKDCNDFLTGLEKDGLCRLLHVEDALFKDGTFKVITDDRRVLMRDQNHLSFFGGEMLIKHHEKMLLQYLQPDTAPQAEAASEQAPGEK